MLLITGIWGSNFFQIDDDEMVADVGEQILKNFGYGVVKANSGNGAIDVYREKQDRIDMVILDMILPDMGGGDAYDRLKKINPGITGVRLNF